jgi:hypothetical protein
MLQFSAMQKKHQSIAANAIKTNNLGIKLKNNYKVVVIVMLQKV